MRPILTARLHLVPVREENAQALWSVLQQPGLREFQDLPDLGAVEFRRAIVARPAELRAGEIGRFEWLLYWKAQLVDDDAQALGWVSLRVPQRGPQTAEIGYSVVGSMRGRGIATEAVAGLVSEGFERAKLRAVRAYCVPENRASRTVLMHNGFVQEGVATHGATVRGQAVDVIAFLLERSSWEALRAVTANRPATRS